MYMPDSYKQAFIVICGTKKVQSSIFESSGIVVEKRFSKRVTLF